MLQHYGLYRVQKSVFAGHLDLERRLDLVDKFELYISSDNDNIILIPLCKSCEDSIFIEGFTEIPQIRDFDFA